MGGVSYARNVLPEGLSREVPTLPGPVNSAKGSRRSLRLATQNQLVSAARRFLSQSNTLGSECPLDLPDQKKRGCISPNTTDSPLTNATRSRNGSTRYVPPIGKYSSEAPRDSDQDRFRQWLSWDNNELEKRKRALLGKTVVGA